MRRPLCLLALILTVALRILLCIIPPYEDPYAGIDGESITLCGRVTAKEYKRGTNAWTGAQTRTLLVTVDHVELAGYAPRTRDLVLVRIPVEDEEQDPDAQSPIGSRIRVIGTMTVFEGATNSGGFDSLLYYRTLGYVFQVRNAHLQKLTNKVNCVDQILYRLRNHLHNVLYRSCVQEEDADILAAMLLGDKGGLSQEIRDLYQSAGIIHILAISGLHIQIIGMGCYRLLLRCHVPVAPRAAVSVILMLLYGRMTGVSASSCRALIMFCLHILAKVTHRTYDLLSALSLAGILILLEQPLYLYNSGFLFSFGAVLSIGLLTPILPADILPASGKALLYSMEERLRERVTGRNRRDQVASLTRISLQGLAATIGTFPVNLMSYGTFPTYSVPLNAMVLPLMNIVMILGLLMLGICSILPFPGRLLAWPIRYLLHFYQLLCQIAAALPAHMDVLGHPETGMVVSFLVLMGILILLFENSKGTGQCGEVPGVVILLWIIGCLQLLTWHPYTGLSIHIIDVGQGDGIYIECDGTRILIDGGSTDRSDVARYELEPLLTYYGARNIDLAIMTHEDQDHTNGLLSLLQEQRETGIRIWRLAMPAVSEKAKGEQYLAVENAARAAGTEVIYLRQGSVMESGGLSLTCLNPPMDADYAEPNETSVTLYLVYGSFTALLTGDLEGEGEAACLAYMAARGDLFPGAADGDDATYDTVTFLKAAHHGSCGATTEAFLAAVHPLYTAISCGRDNRYGHPHEETTQRLLAVGTRILDTRYDGEITIRTNGRSMRIWKHNT